MLARIHQSYSPYVYRFSCVLAVSKQKAELTLNAALISHLQLL
jgi:hypothetical protein